MLGEGLLERWIKGDSKEASPHLAIIGRTGAGKTTLAKRIALHLLSLKKNVIILDFDGGEYSELPLVTLSPPFPIPKGVSLAWLLSQAARPSREEGGGFGIAGVATLLEDASIDEAIKTIKYDLTIPHQIRFAVLWRLALLKKYFVFVSNDVALEQTARYDLSGIVDIRERQVVEQLLCSLIVSANHSPAETFLFVEEGVPGEWLSDLLLLARRRRTRIIYVSQSLPPHPFNFEIVLFTPYFSNPHPLPLPVNPALDRGVWWVGALGIHRLSLR